ncbi:hypothetical protein OIDMADRAFT_158651 [Oidiodendron maius Zn]|uniref:Uncharacterized protein n=1 Tax=Oidiodendron maius (strain Zn) TaxID=913774 RepID=A0A0C3H6J6_OIDMZ|nr:hypothetical protein OIDMADRAFT_158651 [Oidiodendron maius Zn]
MAPLLEDPRIRQTWNQLSQNAETATENAAAGIWAFQHKYLTPCLGSIASALEECTSQCLPDRDERARRLRERGRTRGRAELSFDFYDDWDEDIGASSGGLLGGWGNDELDRLLAGSGSHSGPSDGVDPPPRKKRGMSYGTRGNRKNLEPDPTIIPRTSALGFLGRLPFKLGGTLRYKPSAADLQEHPGALREEIRDEEEGEPLISDEHSDDDGNNITNMKTRKRSSTNSSGHTSDSFRSRGDLFPSDGEDDAVPLDDEFAVALERRMASDDRSSGKTRASKGKRSRNASSRKISTTHSSNSRPSLVGHRTNSTSSFSPSPDILTPDMARAPSLADLLHEEESVRIEEDAELERKRQAATRLAVERGLQTEGHIPIVSPASKTKAVSIASKSSEERTTETEAPHVENASEPGENNFVPARLPHFG